MDQDYIAAESSFQPLSPINDPFDFGLPAAFENDECVQGNTPLSPTLLTLDFDVDITRTSPVPASLPSPLHSTSITASVTTAAPTARALINPYPATVVSAQSVAPTTLKRIKHNTLDAERRRRETKTLRTLTAIISPPKSSKVSVLETAVETIQKLRAEIAENAMNKEKRSRTHNGKRSVQKRTREESEESDDTSYSEDDSAQDESQVSLHTTITSPSSISRSIFTSSSVMQLLVNADSGTILTGNYAWKSFCGIPAGVPPAYFTCPIIPPRRHWLEHDADGVADLPPPTCDDPVDNETPQANPSMSSATKAALWSVFHGRSTTVQCRYKMYNYAGVLWDMTLNVWLTTIADPSGALGRPGMTFLHVVARHATIASTHLHD